MTKLTSYTINIQATDRATVFAELEKFASCRIIRFGERLTVRVIVGNEANHKPLLYALNHMKRSKLLRYSASSVKAIKEARQTLFS